MQFRTSKLSYSLAFRKMFQQKLQKLVLHYQDKADNRGSGLTESQKVTRIVTMVE